MSRDFFLETPTHLQKELMDAYRLTPEFRTLYGNRLIESGRNKDRVEFAINTIKTYTKEQDVSLASHRQQIVDLLYSRSVLGIRMWEYYAYGLADKSIEERMAFLSEQARYHFYEKLNPDKEARGKLTNKFATYKMIPKAFKREIVRISGEESKNDFISFCESNDRIIVKPNAGSLGDGVKLFSVADYESPEALFKFLMEKYDVSKTKTILLEEPIKQHPFMAQFHEHSVNSLRIFTYFDDSQVHLVCAWMKVGKDGALVDNGSAGGMLAAVDCQTGVIYTDARDELNNCYVAHPNTNVAFKGLKIACWEKLADAVKEWAMAFPTVRLIGWDVAVSEKGEAQLVEGNCVGMVNLLQVATQTGMLKDFTKAVEWDRYK